MNGGLTMNRDMKHTAKKWMVGLVAIIILEAMSFPTLSLADDPKGPSTTTKRIDPLAQASSTWTATEGADVSQAVNIAGARIIELASLDGDALENHRGSIVLTRMPVGSLGTTDFELTPFDVFTPDAHIVAAAGNSERILPRPDVRLYRGRSLDQSGGSMFLSIGGSDARAIIQYGDEMTYILPAPVQGKRAENIVIPGDSLPPPDVEAQCDVDLLPETAVFLNSFSEAADRPSAALNSTRLQADIMVDVDDGLFTHAFARDTTRASNYVASLFGAISAIYERDINIQLRINRLTIWTTADPFDGADTRSQLSKYLQYNQAMRQGTSRTVAHLLDYAHGGGLAYLDVPCHPNYAYGVTNLLGNAPFPVAGYAWDLHAVAHELGHNFGSPHTHCYAPPIDMCYGSEDSCYNGPAVPSVGTIMSYCHLTKKDGGDVTMNFHPRCVDVIRSAVERSQCLKPVADDTDAVTLSSGTPQTGTIAAPAPGRAMLGQSQFVIDVPNGATQLRIDLSGNQNVNLYVRFGQRITIQDGWPVINYQANSLTETETLTVTPASSPALQPGRYFIAIGNFGPGEASFTLTATVR
jgi:hypothetical protein